ncbi:biopolymer transporter ExbD [uncultured Shewanella sp.]|uniref:ExbD/TolR family protein n=1 Tax=uncultured Shewanella sp. TaxID=173975 RepID=UPI0026198C3D|nr:biopolymer transporter ExbD [uncultured Shewanella sp.]
MISSKNTLSSQAQAETTALDLTPLIDIIFIVLVFLLLTANVPLLSLQVDIPAAANADLTPVVMEKQIAINVMPSSPQWAINGKDYDHWSEFEAAFNTEFASQPNANLIIAADKSAPIEPLMQLLNLLQQHEISQTQILMENTQ